MPDDRQWVFTVPKPLRLVLARDPAWTRWTGALVVRAIGAWQRRVARKRGLPAPRTGAVTFVQRFGGLVNLNVHFHLVVPDGVFVDDEAHGLRFELLPVPTNAEVLAILDRLLRRIARRLASSRTPMASTRTRGPTCSHRSRPTQLPPGARRPRLGRPSAASSGSARGAKASRCTRASSSPRTIAPRSNGCAGTARGPRSRRSASRGPPTGASRTSSSDPGPTAAPTSSWRPSRSCADSSASSRRPRRHLVRYSGVFGPASKLRTKLRALVPSDPTQEAGAHCAEPRPPASSASRARRLPWADLLQRVFADDVLQCPCGGRRSIVAIVTDTALARALLAGLGLATEPVTFAPARAPPQADLPWDDAS